MPTVHREGPYRFFFGSFDCVKPPHLHIWGESEQAQFWLDPVMIKENNGFAQHELNEIQGIIDEYQSEFLEIWREHCSQHG